MVVYAPMFVLGLAMAAIGTVMLFLSFRPRERRGRMGHEGVRVVFIGPIPIVFGGRGRWALVGVAVAAVIALLFLGASVRPDLIRW
ncbi:MAG: DUF131 domain-containing protein [Candidatus Bathyarchaeota archaeon]|nr:DUF131 domain-containing protein [Candidatus Bathyarchaeota archaeon]